MEDEKRLVMMVAAGKALDYKKEKPSADAEEILRKVMKDVRARRDDKVAAIAAATRAIKYFDETPELGNKAIMQKIMNALPEISRTSSSED